MELPTDLLEEVVRRGQILHSDIFENIDHPKFFVVMGISENKIAGFFYINSEINRYIQKKEEQLRMQYPLYVADYVFLAHDSYICATNIMELPKAVILKSIQENRTKIIDSLKPEHLTALLEKVRQSKLFSNVVKRRYFY